MKKYSELAKNKKVIRILIVDDIPDNLSTLVELIEKHIDNSEVLQSNSAELALKILEVEVPDIIITDWDMPGMDGLEMIKKIKTTPKFEYIPIIMCTGEMTSSSNLATALAAGADDYIRKPVDPIELTARVFSMLELSSRQKYIMELNHINNTILSTIVHDLKGPVSYLNQLVEWVLSKKMNRDELYEYFRIAKPDVSSSHSLLENLLVWAKSMLEGNALNTKKIYLKEIIDETINIQKPLADKKNIRIISRIDYEDLIDVDEYMIKSITRNLLNNAIKFTKEGGKIDITILEENEFVKLSFSDEGKGIDDDTINKIRNSKILESKSGTRSESGNGLGLKLTHDFIKLHKGELLITNKENSGAVFTVVLPKIQISR